MGVDGVVLPNDRLEAIRWYDEKLKAASAVNPDALYEMERWLARNDLFYLLLIVCKRADINRDWLFARCREVQENPNGYVDLWGRDHYKSTIITFGATIKDLLNDPNLTVGIFSHNRPIAKAFFAQIKREFDGNKELYRLFPEIFWRNPQQESPRWSIDEGIILRRSQNLKEASIEAWGLVDSQPAGKHFKLRVYDDIVDKDTITTPEMIEKVNKAWELSINLGTQDGVSRYVGTRYHFNDSYSLIIERGAAKPRVHPATIDGSADGVPVLLTKEQLRERRRDMGPYTFSAQMLLDPVADKAQGFKKDWLQYWPAKNTQGLNLAIVCDPASKKKETADYTFMAVVGIGDDGNYRVVDMLRDRLNLTERADRLFAWHRKYRPLAVAYEEYGLQADIEHFKDRMNRENYRFIVTPVGGKVKKEDRIRRLVPLFEQGRMLMPDVCFHRNCEGENQDLTKIFVNEEYLPFPVGHHDDMLDGLSRIVELDMKRPSKNMAKRGVTQTKNKMGWLRR